MIEVLTRLESGWWDGLLGDERGWFPSNYVTVISDEEAEMALSASEYSSMQQVSEIDSTADESISTATVAQSGLNRGDLLNSDMGHLDSRDGLVELATLEEGSTLASDFWMPQVTPEGTVSVRHFPASWLSPVHLTYWFFL